MSGAGASVTAFNGSGTDYEATITPVESGTVTLNIAANVAEDALGNPNSAATEQTVQVEMTGPTVTSEVPSETTLLQNYPNPFSVEAWIPYRLSEDADVTVTIHTIDGRVVRHFAVRRQPAGFYEMPGRALHWDRKNALGEPVSSGIYFYTLTAGDFRATRKMLVKK